MAKKFDFCGWATRANVKCADGRTILKDAFADQDGMTVPLVWNHQHDGVENVLGHAILQARPEGMYAYCEFNDSDNARAAKEAVRHGDVGSLSIWANKLKESANGVAHGIIREVSLVLAGANPEARIESFVEHSGFSDDIEAMIYTTGNTGLSLTHSDDEEDEEDKKKSKSKDEEEDTKEESSKKDDEDKEKEPEPESKDDDKKASEGDSSEDEEDEEKKKMKNNELSHADDEKQAGEGKTIKEIVDTMTEEQKNAMYALIGAAVEGAEGDDDEEDEMNHNLFDNESEYIAHSIDVPELIQDGKKFGSLREAFAAHCEELGASEEELMHADDRPTRYGIMPSQMPEKASYTLGIDALFPEARALSNIPEFVKRDTGWVDPVMNGVSHSPFARFKTVFADITEEEARAKGYVKGNYKVEEVFSLLKREITPQTVYKKQRFDRDDLIDITDFDVLAWVKAEMRMMLDEEIARAILVGDGRSDAADSKIYETHVKSIYHDDDFYSNKVAINVSANATDDEIAKATIRGIIKARKDYRGSGNPTFFCSAETLSNLLLLEDGMGRIIYDTEEKLRTALRVSKIVETEVMEGLTRTVTNGTTTVTMPLIGIIVNLTDYRVGADKGGAVNMFDDFDIDYNQQKFLIETRISGMLIKPHSAMVIELNKAAAQG